MNLRTWMETDARWSERLRLAEKPGTRRKIAALLAHTGDSWYWLAGLALIYWLSPGFWAVWALKTGIAILITALTVGVLKFTFRRTRPEGNWGSIYRSTDPHSFPSGHAARGALLAVTSIFWAPAWLAAALIVWAPLMALSRVAMGVHYLSDIIAGFLLGLIMGSAFSVLVLLLF